MRYFSKEVLDIVDALTKKSDYSQYIKELVGHKKAEIVKAADLLDNGYDLWINKALLVKDKAWYEKQIKKYGEAYKMLGKDLPTDLREAMRYVNELLTSTFSGRH